MKKKKWYLVVVGIILISVLIFFQNCAKVIFEPIVSSDFGSNGGPIPSQNSRLKVIFPEPGELQQIDYKVKALLVVDNSATMENSQKNLSDQVAVLLDRLSQYDSEIQIVSTSYQADDGRTDIEENFLYTTLNSNTPISLEGYAGTSVKAELTANTVSTYKLDPTQTVAQKKAAILEIANKIRSLGTQGSSSEAPFAVAAMQGLKFFNDGDRGFIFIITDEDDTNSLSKLSIPLLKVSEYAPTGEYENINSKTYTATITEQQFIASGECTTPVYGADHVSIIRYEIVNISMPFPTGESCGSFARSSNCQLSCSPNNRTYEIGGAGSCSTNVYLPPGTTLNSCSETVTTVPIEKIVVGADITILPFGLKQENLNSIGSASSRSALFVNEFKTKVLSKLNEKYLISIVTNVEGQSCDLNPGQSKDTFFSSIKTYFPEQNFSIDTICSTSAQLGERLKKIASNFFSIINSKYLVGLTSGESVKSARIKLNGASEFVQLFNGTDFKIENNQLIFLKEKLNNFEQIELQIVR